MGIAQRRERQKAEVKDLILAAARRIALETGFEALSMRRIAQAIEYAPATIYLYFKSRDDIIRELARESFELFLRSFKPAACIDDPWERYAHIGRLYVAFAQEQPEAYRLAFMTKLSDGVKPSKPLKAQDDPGDRFLAMLRATVTELIESERMRPADPTLVSELSWAAMHGIVSIRLNRPGMSPADVRQTVEEMLRTIRVGLETRA